MTRMSQLSGALSENHIILGAIAIVGTGVLSGADPAA